MKIFLHGEIGKKFGKEWDLNVKSPNEALRAINANTDNFFKFLSSKENENIHYRLKKKKKPVKNQDELGLESKNIKNLHLFPVIKGAGSNDKEAYRYMGYGAAGLGLSYGIDALGDYVGGTWGKVLGFIADIGYEISGALITQGAIMLLQKDPPAPPAEDVAPAQKNTSSFTFARPLNNTTQGAPIPIGYGRLRIGTHVVSSHLMNTRLVAFNQVRAEVIDENNQMVGAINVDHYTL